MSAAWHSPKAFAFIREQFKGGRSDSWIAGQLGISKGSVVSWRRANVGVRLGKKSTTAPPRTIGPAMSEVYSGPVPDWKSAECDALIKRARDAGVTNGAIEAFFGVGRERLRAKIVKLDLPTRRPTLNAEGINGWGTSDGDAELRRRRGGSEHADTLAAWFGVSQRTFRMRCKALDLPRRTGNEVKRRSKARVEAPGPSSILLPPKPDHTTRGTRDAGGRGGSVFQFRTFTRAAPVAPAKRGGCQWPLTCDAPADGKWCAEHSRILRAA